MSQSNTEAIIPKTFTHDSLYMLPACLIYMVEYKNKRSWKLIPYKV